MKFTFLIFMACLSSLSHGAWFQDWMTPCLPIKKGNTISISIETNFERSRTAPNYRTSLPSKFAYGVTNTAFMPGAEFVSSIGVKFFSRISSGCDEMCRMSFETKSGLVRKSCVNFGALCLYSKFEDGRSDQYDRMRRSDESKSSTRTGAESQSNSRSRSIYPAPQKVKTHDYACATDNEFLECELYFFLK